MADSVADMKVTSREFQRQFARMKAIAVTGEPVHIVSEGEQFVFQIAKSRSWRGALQGKGRGRREDVMANREARAPFCWLVWPRER
jgi:hypothetical protein